MIEFLVTTSEDKRVPPLEPDHVTVVDGKINDQMVNLIMRVSMITCTLADEDLFCTRRRKKKQHIAEQGIIQDKIGCGQSTHSFKGDKILIHREGAKERKDDGEGKRGR